MGSLCNPLWFPLTDLIFLLASQPTKNCGLWSKGHFGTTGHVITVVFAVAFCHAIFGVEVCVGVGDGDVGEILLVVFFLFQYVRDKVRISDPLLNNQDSLCLVFPFLVKMAILLSAILPTRNSLAFEFSKSVCDNCSWFHQKHQDTAERFRNLGIWPPLKDYTDKSRVMQVSCCMWSFFQCWTHFCTYDSVEIVHNLKKLCLDVQFKTAKEKIRIEISP